MTKFSFKNQQQSGVQILAGHRAVSSSVPPSQPKTGAVVIFATQNQSKKGGASSSGPPNQQKIGAVSKGEKPKEHL